MLKSESCKMGRGLASRKGFEGNSLVLSMHRGG